MPKSAKLSTAGRLVQQVEQPLSPLPSTSADLSPHQSRCVSPHDPIRKVRGRPPNRPAAENLDIDKAVADRLEALLSKTTKVMAKLSKFGFSSEEFSSEEDNKTLDANSVISSMSPTSGYGGTKSCNSSKRHRYGPNNKTSNPKKPRMTSGRKSPAKKEGRKRRCSSNRNCHHCREESEQSDDELRNHNPKRQEDFNEFLQAASETFRTKRGKMLLFPWEFIKNDDSKKGSPGTSSWPQYLGALFIMSRHRDVPVHWGPHIIKHMEQLCTMAEDWSWPTCLKWSEKVFRMIEDGRLANGWSDGYEIKDIQRDVCLLGVRAKLAPTEGKLPFEYKSRPQYDKLSDGTPCGDWNSGKDCGFQYSHGVHPNRECHLCAWCVKKFSRTNAHREIDCINKRKWEKPQSTDDNNKTNKDF